MTFVSTGRLPPLEQVQELIAAAHEQFCTDAEGHLSQVYPALARMDPDLFGITLVSATGETVSAGDCAAEFTLMSVSKPFAFALMCQLLGTKKMRLKNWRERHWLTVQFGCRAGERA